MNYEEKRELRLQISQLLADAGLNQGTIKEMVTKEIKNKVERAIDQCITNLNEQCSSGNYIAERAIAHLGSYAGRLDIERAVKEELKNRVFQIVLKKCEESE